MIYGDSAYAQNFQPSKADGWVFYYPMRGIGGPYNGWSRAEADTITAAGLLRLGLFFPGVDGALSAAMARSWGDPWVGMDIEPGAQPRGSSNVTGPAAAWKADGLITVVYCHSPEWTWWAPYFDMVWVSQPQNVIPGPWPQQDPWGHPLGGPPGQPHGWQKQFNVAGADYSEMTDDFTPEADMTSEEHTWLQTVFNQTTDVASMAQRVLDLTQQVTTLQAKVDKIPTTPAGGTAGGKIQGTITGTITP